MIKTGATLVELLELKTLVVLVSTDQGDSGRVGEGVQPGNNTRPIQVVHKKGRF